MIYFQVWRGEGYTAGFMKTVPAVYTLIMYTIYLSLCSQVAEGTSFRKHTVAEGCDRSGLQCLLSCVGRGEGEGEGEEKGERGRERKDGEGEGEENGVRGMERMEGEGEREV